jgi:hypothetical protein
MSNGNGTLLVLLMLIAMSYSTTMPIAVDS